MPHGWQLLTIVGIWLAYFYINYIVLIPRLMMTGRTALYIFAVLLLSALSFTVLKNSDIYFIRENLEEQRVTLEQYSDVMSSYEDKVAEIRRRRWTGERERGGEHRGPRPPAPDGPMPNIAPPMPEAGIPGPGTLFPLGPDTTGFSATDSLAVLRISQVQSDTIVLTPREEEYGLLSTEYGRAIRRSRDTINQNYNPLHFSNYEYSFVIVILYLMSLVLAFVQKSVNEEQRRSELEGEKTAAELAYLKQQINPHFLFNTLNAIYSYTLSVSEPASEAVLKLSSILRYMLYETNREKVPLADEMAVVDDYIDLQKLRMTDKTTITITTQGDPVGLRIEPMLLIPILENAFKYGVDSFEGSFVDIAFEIEGRHFGFDVSNRIVRRNSPKNNSSGIGIKNIRRRLDLTYGNDYELTTVEKDGVFSVSLRLNLK